MPIKAPEYPQKPMHKPIEPASDASKRPILPKKTQKAFFDLKCQRIHTKLTSVAFFAEI